VEIRSATPYGSPDLNKVPDFSLEPNIDTVDVSASGQAQFQIKAVPRGGFNLPVLITASNPVQPKGTPPGPLKLLITNRPVKAGGTVTLRVEADLKNTPPGIYPIALVGTIGNLKHVESVQVRIVKTETE
jgi:hypothetical protein